MVPMSLTYGLLGRYLGHSFSPAIHRQLGAYDYQLIELPPEKVGPFLQSGQFQGLNVTIPYKKTVMAFCHHLSPAARRIGSVNTIVKQPDGTLYGDNTDYKGFQYLLQSAGAQIRGKKVLILGSGGASRTVRAVLSDLKAGSVVTISRSGPDHYGNLDRHQGTELIVNATPVGMYPNTGVSPVDLRLFPNCEGVFDLIYNPAKTQLLLEAERRGLLWSNGLGMLVAQAHAAAERFLARSIPVGRIVEITADLKKQTCNLLLIGMPGCGKTTVGEILAKRLNRVLEDLDRDIEGTAGCSIPDLFAREGEEGFRIREHQALCQVSKESGKVIACGGGIVTRKENWDPMRQNSTVIYPAPCRFFPPAAALFPKLSPWKSCIKAGRRSMKSWRTSLWITPALPSRQRRKSFEDGTVAFLVCKPAAPSVLTRSIPNVIFTCTICSLGKPRCSPISYWVSPVFCLDITAHLYRILFQFRGRLSMVRFSWSCSPRLWGFLIFALKASGMSFQNSNFSRPLHSRAAEA